MYTIKFHETDGIQWLFMYINWHPTNQNKYIHRRRSRLINSPIFLLVNWWRRQAGIWLNRISSEDDAEENVRFTEIPQILMTYKDSGIVDQLPPTECHRGHPRSMHEYQASCIQLQTKLMAKHRHFLFVTGNHYTLAPTFDFSWHR